MNTIRNAGSIRPLSWRYGAMALVMLAGCKVGPDHVAPGPAAPAGWRSELPTSLIGEPTDPNLLASWWTTLDDPQLSSLIERAVAGNLNLKTAQSRLRESRARRSMAEGRLFPTLNASGSATSRRTDTNVGFDSHGEVYSAGFDAGWELDLFGGVRRSIEAAEADLAAGEEDLRDVLVSLLAETALNYVELRTFQSRLAAAEASLATQEASYELTQWRSQAGLDDELAMYQARYNLENTRSQIPSLRSGLSEAMNRLAVLLGETPGDLHAELAEPRAIPLPPAEIAVGVPAETLRRRPDVRRAERELAAQTARVGVAMANLYPQLTLNGSIGLETTSLRDPLSERTWSISGGPRITLPLFDRTIRPNIEVQSALQEQALIRYEAAVLTCLEEVENALVAYGQELQRRENLREAMEAAQSAATLAQYKYQAGLTDFGNVLDAERSLLSFQDQLRQSDGAVTSNVIRLYKALGGGWTPMTAVAATQGPAEPL
ncbi:MAG: efflux transporter outer membrane subunit [Planctomycetota bacterium]|nr:efflux transporter outer membrane subunit [Planctomycetota bacterium]